MACGCGKTKNRLPRAAARRQLKEESAMPIRGQRPARVRHGGQGIEVGENGLPVQAPGPLEDSPDYSKLSRAELNKLAKARGLNPKDYRNRDDITEALKA